MTQMNTALLPNGLMDLLNPDAQREADAITALMSVFQSFGFNRVKPPMVEFEESLLAPGPGASLTRQTFRLMDPVSQRMMGVRADTTAQISRIASSRLANEARPLRLAYAADVLRVNGSQLRPERQFCQVGCELIGDEGFRADSEIALIALKGLSDLGIQNLTIDLTVPSLVETLLDSYAVSAEERQIIRDHLSRRDRDALTAKGSDISNMLSELLACVAPADQALQKLLSLKLPENAQAQAKLLKSVYDDLMEALKVYGLNDINVTIDAVEHKGFEYHKGVSFTLFAKGLRGELGSGGRYQTAHETATGFTVYMDTVLRAMPIQKEDNKIVSAKKWADIRDAQKNNSIAIREG